LNCCCKQNLGVLLKHLFFSVERDNHCACVQDAAFCCLTFPLLSFTKSIMKLLYYNGKKKIVTNCHTKHLVSEYTLITTILNRICEMTKKLLEKLLEYLKDDITLDSLRHLLQIRTWGTKWKKVFDRIDEWAAWR
jgi:hypothetical protein